MKRQPTIALARNYRIKNVEDAKRIAKDWLLEIDLAGVVSFGLPEVDDRYHVWRVPLLNGKGHNPIGEIVIDAKTTIIISGKTTKRSVIEARLLGRRPHKAKNDSKDILHPLSAVRNTVGFGNSEELMIRLPSNSIDLIFTSPPYYNARPEYEDFLSYEEYLFVMRKVIHEANRILKEGRFFVINISPVLIRRANRNKSSKRIAVPFDLHRLFIEEGFEFVDDIIWAKPEGAGWATNRGRRFAADRNPMQYKPVPITEYVLVYRSKTDKLIDWHIRNVDKKVLAASKIDDNYDRTNIWYIHPASHPKHPAVFPVELAEKVIRYYSFVGDIVMDPFAGIGTVGKAAIKLSRKFVLFDNNKEYIVEIKANLEKWLGNALEDVFWLNTEPPEPKYRYLDL